MKHKGLVKLLVLVGIVVLITIGIFVILKVCGVFELSNIKGVFTNNKWLGVPLFIFFQTLFTTLLCFVPATSMTFILLGVGLFGANIWTFLICFTSVILSSVAMDLIGRFGGSKVVKYFIGEKSYESGEKLLNEKGFAYVPIMYLLPVFPDDAICMLCGVYKLKFWLHLSYIVLCRGIGIFTIVFGISFIPSEVANFQSKNIWDYIEVITICAFWVLLLLKVANKIVERKNKK